MPIYEYKCKKCGHGFEHLARTLSETAPRCPACGAAGPRKQFSSFSAAVHARPTCEACPSGTCPSRDCAPGACPLSQN